jgi:cation diffusion facilitator CzcD-associated flavoprotein CzcO
MQRKLSPGEAVAVIGGGPAGLVVARWLKRHGLTPQVLEAAKAVGGQWNGQGPASATWPGMRTNTSRVATCFSDLAHEAALPVFPRREEMQAYLQRYAAAFGLDAHIRCEARVEAVEREGDGWRVRWRGPDGQQTQAFPFVVVASGAEGAPVIPKIAGLDRFTGALGALHSAHYDGVERFRGRAVLVLGCSISALEIASDLAFGGAASVTVANRRQRYVLPKLIGGVPTDHVVFNRIAALAQTTLPPELVAEQMKAQVLAAGGDPATYGGPRPDADLFAAGITQAQHFLPAVAEGRIAVRPWVERIEGRTASFADGARLEADAIILGTGYAPALGCLGAELAERLGAGGGPDLHAQTFHPGLPGLAFVGLYNLVGPKLPVLELQARWLAAILAGQTAAPSGEELAAGTAAACAARLAGLQPVAPALALDFARRLGVDPDPTRWPKLARALLFGPLSPAMFRLEGPDADAGAAARVAADAAAFGAVTTPAFTDPENAICIALGQKVGAQPPPARGPAATLETAQ